MPCQTAERSASQDFLYRTDPTERYQVEARLLKRNGLMGLCDARQLIKLMVKRDFMGRYRGSLLGTLWPILNPLGHMLLYMYLFGMILKVRFSPDSGMANFALYLMAGLLPWTAMAETLACATTKILEAPNLVKRVVFPLEILPLVPAISAFANAMIALGLLAIFVLIFTGKLFLTMLFVPLILLSQFLFTVGLGWFLASIGVFIRDMRHIVPLGLAMWLYITPIIYPASAVPDTVKFVLDINPIAGMVMDYRRVMLEGSLPSIHSYIFYTSIAIVVFFSGLYFFTKTKKSFADIM